MDVFPNSLHTVLMLGSLQGFILALILVFKKKGNKTANRFLAIILFYLSFAIIFHSLSHARVLPFLEIHTIILGITFVFIIPLLYFYVKALTSYRFLFKKKDGIHFLPFVFCLLLSLLFLLSEHGLIHLFSMGKDMLHNIISIISFIVFAFYILLANIKLFHHTKTINNNFSNVDRINLFWLRLFLLLLTFLLIFAVVFDLIFHLRNWDIIWLACTIIIYIISYFGLAQPAIFTVPVVDVGLSMRNKSKKYKKSSLDEEKAQKHLMKLKSEMQLRKSYLDKNISLSKLAEDLGISIHHLSQIINEKLGKNFYDFVNSQRIQEAEKQLINPGNKHLSIAAIAFEVGFNSLSAFNAAFKKFTGLTPSRFRKKHSSS
jgi:AraC-like DNA-binding protein